MSITPFDDRVPVFAAEVFVHPDATIIGAVSVGAGASIWPGAVLRGDLEAISIGARTSFQDGSVAHTDTNYPLTIGDDCIVGHAVIAHGATVGDRCLIGMGATLLNGCVIGDDSIVGANALVTQGKVFPPRSLIVGAPAKVVREVSDADLAARAAGCQTYVERAAKYLALGLGADLGAFRR